MKFGAARHTTLLNIKGWLSGWLFCAKRPFETVFQSISGRLPETGRKKREMTDEIDLELAIDPLPATPPPPLLYKKQNDTC